MKSEKKVLLVVGAIGVLTALVVMLIAVFLPGKFTPSKTTIIYAEQGESKDTRTVTFTGDEAVYTRKVGNDTIERGLSSEESADLAQRLEVLSVKGSVPDEDDACATGIPIDAIITITDNNTEGKAIFCTGVGVDQKSNLDTPIELDNLIREILALENETLKPAE